MNASGTIDRSTGKIGARSWRRRCGVTAGRFLNDLTSDDDVLVLGIARDERLNEIDWLTLEALARAINRVADGEVIRESELAGASDPFGRGRYDWHREEASRSHLEATLSLEARLAAWRAAMRAFAK